MAYQSAHRIHTSSDAQNQSRGKIEPMDWPDPPNPFSRILKILLTLAVVGVIVWGMFNSGVVL